MQPQHSPGGPEFRNMLIAIVLATAILFGWQMFYEHPRQVAAQTARAAAEATAAKVKAKTEIVAHTAVEKITAVPRLPIASDNLSGALPLVGNRIDTLTLSRYRVSKEKDSDPVKLLAPQQGEDAYFAEIGVLPGTGMHSVPDASTRWQAQGSELTPETPVTLRWTNPQGITFERKIALDAHYMFTITTTVKNRSGAAVAVYPYGLVSRNYADTGKHYIFMHEGPLGVMNDVLNDVTYKTLRQDGEQTFAHSKGWIGITDKYWLTALIPDQATPFDASFKYFKRGEQDAYQADLRAEELTIPAGEERSFTMHLFAGAKKVKLIDNYRAELGIPLFDRAVDFGSLYFLTKPIFLLLSYFQGLVGNFGIAILLLTVVIKILLFPLANKSFTSMAHMKQMMPRMLELKERHKDDKLKMNQAILEMYKKEKVNPMSGCLPLLLQIPVFFALYRVLFVTIEMRHAPFYAWIQDLSAPDPTTLFNLFGLIPWDPPSFLHIGVLPIVMCITMVIQQKLNPKPADEVQAMVLSYMPYMFLVLFASFPAGLVLYWAWNNLLSILQQLYIKRKLTKKGLR